MLVNNKVIIYIIKIYYFKILLKITNNKINSIKSYTQNKVLIVKTNTNKLFNK